MIAATVDFQHGHSNHVFIAGRLAFQSPTNEIIVVFTKSCFGSNLREANSLCRSLALVGRRTSSCIITREGRRAYIHSLFRRPICCTDESRNLSLSVPCQKVIQFLIAIDSCCLRWLRWSMTAASTLLEYWQRRGLLTRLTPVLSAA